MNIIYISPFGSVNPHLFPTLKKTFAEQGHSETDNPNEATHCFVDIHSGDISYDQNILTTIVEMGIQIIGFDSREWGCLNGDTWMSPAFFDADIWFVRNMSKNVGFPKNLHPFDWPYFKDHDFPPVSKEELFSRPFDCCFTGTESPARKNIIEGIIKDGRLKPYYDFRDHTQRIPYGKWIDEYKEAKLYISCEGGGMTNERPLQLFSIAPMLKVENNHVPVNEYEDGINCLEISEHPTEEEIEKVADILIDRDWLYDIYLNGIKYTKEKLSAESVAAYVLTKLNEHSYI